MATTTLRKVGNDAGIRVAPPREKKLSGDPMPPRTIKMEPAADPRLLPPGNRIER